MGRDLRIHRYMRILKLEVNRSHLILGPSPSSVSPPSSPFSSLSFNYHYYLATSSCRYGLRSVFITTTTIFTTISTTIPPYHHTTTILIFYRQEVLAGTERWIRLHDLIIKGELAPDVSCNNVTMLRSYCNKSYITHRKHDRG